MAILLKKDKKNQYISSTGVVTNEQKKTADKIHHDLYVGIKDLERKLLKSGMINKTGTKKNALRVWYEFGNLLNAIGKKYKIFGTNDELYFWPVIYNYVSRNIQKSSPPKNYKQLYRNHFKQCSILAGYKWAIVKRVGTWAEWRDLLDNKILLEDKRILNWLIKRIIKSKIGHKEFRPFLHSFRREMKSYDTTIFSDKELKKLLSKKVLLINDKKN
jgi:hypothetical protein